MHHGQDSMSDSVRDSNTNRGQRVQQQHEQRTACATATRTEYSVSDSVTDRVQRVQLQHELTACATATLTDGIMTASQTDSKAQVCRWQRQVHIKRLD